MSIVLPQREPCPFCENLAGRYPCAFVSRHPLFASFVNPAQYGKGAMLIVPSRHAPTLLDLTSTEIAAIYTHAQALMAALAQTFGPAGYNVFQNNGIAAGQSVPHFHLHVVPRYGDDAPSSIFNQERLTETPIQERLVIAQAISAHLLTNCYA